MFELARILLFALTISAPGWRGLLGRAAIGVLLIGAAFGWVTDWRFSVVVPGGDADIGAGIILFYGITWLASGLIARAQPYGAPFRAPTALVPMDRGPGLLRPAAGLPPPSGGWVSPGDQDMTLNTDLSRCIAPPAQTFYLPPAAYTSPEAQALEPNVAGFARSYAGRMLDGG